MRLRQAIRGVVLVLMTLGLVLIGLSSTEYVWGTTTPGFVVEKGPLGTNRLWLGSLYVHVVAALLGFALCLALMTRTLQRKKKLHRWLGRVAGGITLGALVPSGAVLAFHAKGGGWSTLGFLLTGGIVAVCMCVGITAARRHDLVLHRRAMRHVFAQMSVAVSSRVILATAAYLGFDHDNTYVLALWVPVVLSFALAELAASSTQPLIERIRRASSFLTLRFPRFARPLPPPLERHGG
jgi:uncharacterized membrane protein